MVKLFNHSLKPLMKREGLYLLTFFKNKEHKDKSYLLIETKKSYSIKIDFNITVISGTNSNTDSLKYKFVDISNRIFINNIYLEELLKLNHSIENPLKNIKTKRELFDIDERKRKLMMDKIKIVKPLKIKKFNTDCIHKKVIKKPENINKNISKKVLFENVVIKKKNNSPFKRKKIKGDSINNIIIFVEKSILKKRKFKIQSNITKKYLMSLKKIVFSEENQFKKIEYKNNLRALNQAINLLKIENKKQCA